MTLKEKHALLWLISASGIFFVTVVSAIWLPPAIRERSGLINWKMRLYDKAAEETMARKALEEVHKETNHFKSEAEGIRQNLLAARFTPAPESDIPGFIEELQRLFSAPGLNLLQVAYQRRSREGGFVSLPFDGHIEGSYEAIRKLIGVLDNHPRGIRIDQLEIVNLENERHRVQIKVKCTTRFGENG